jgi:hypothetical protein
MVLACMQERHRQGQEWGGHAHAREAPDREAPSGKTRERLDQRSLGGCGREQVGLPCCLNRAGLLTAAIPCGPHRIHIQMTTLQLQVDQYARGQ